MCKPVVSWLAILSAALLLQVATAAAQGPGGYPGVVPGSGNNLPRVAELKGKSGTWVTWPGFLALPDGTSRIFLQTTGTVSYERTDAPKKIVISLEGANVFLSNNRNPLETSHFNTPVNRAYLKMVGKKLTLIIELRVPVTATVGQTTEADGFNYLLVDFPAGQFPAAPKAPTAP